jgi:hypothetical protein
MRFFRTALATVVVALAISVAAAQSGGLTIHVSDSNGPLPGATVTISHETGYVKTTSMITDAEGRVEMPVLRVGKGYILEVSFPGYAPRRIADVHVTINENQDIPVLLSEEIIERVKVTAESDVVDLEKTTTSTKFSDEFIQDLPVPGRSYQNVLTMAPGVMDADGDGNPNVHGARSRDFKTEVGGISNVDPLTGQYMSDVNPNSIEEMEVITAGAGVEFSRAQGGFAQIIQKQGSNDFEGLFEFLFRSSKLDGDGAHDYSNMPDLGFDLYQPGVMVSGPIVKDKLWYRLTHELLDADVPVSVPTGVEVMKYEIGLHSDQVTWQASPRNRMALSFDSNPIKIKNFGISSITPPESAQYREWTGETYTLSWTAPYSPKILIDTKVAWQDLNTKINPQTRGESNNCVIGMPFLEKAYCLNLNTSEVSGSYFRTMEDHRQRLTVRTDANIYGGRFWGLQHQFKLGLSVENERYFRQLERLSNIFFQQIIALDPESPTPERSAYVYAGFGIPAVGTARAVGTTWGIYGEDQIKPMSNLTIKLGLRVDREEIDSVGHLPFYPEEEYEAFERRREVATGETIRQSMNPIYTSYEDFIDFGTQLADQLGMSFDDLPWSSEAQQGAFTQKTRRKGNMDITNTNVSPFLSVSWDPWNNGKTKFTVAARRYHSKIVLGIPLLEVEPPTTGLAFKAKPVVIQGTEYWQITKLQESVSPAANVYVVDRDLETPHNDEFMFMFERELWAETSIKLTYINRKFRNQYQDIDLNHVPRDFGKCRWGNTSNNQTLVPSPGVGDVITDLWTGEQFIDDEPGDGDGRIDDCVGDMWVPSSQDIDELSEDPFARQNRVERPDGVEDLYMMSPAWGDYFSVGNYNKADYKAYMLELIRRQYRSWELQASYTWSKAVGDGEDYRQELGNDRSLLKDEYGYQSYDQRHVVKVIATTITPWGFRLGGVVTWESGLPYSLIKQQVSYDSTPPSFSSIGSSSSSTGRVRQQYKTGRRNDQRNDSYWNFDLKFTKEMNIGRGLNLQLSAEIFNLFNDGTFIIYNPVTETGQQINGFNVGSYRFGRRWQVGFKIAF